MSFHPSRQFAGKPRVLLGVLATAALVGCGAASVQAGRSEAEGASYIDGIDVAQGFPAGVAIDRTVVVDASHAEGEAEAAVER